MKIIIFATFYPPYKGGYAHSVFGLVNSLNKQGHQITVVSCNTNQQEETEEREGVRILRVSCWNSKKLNGSYPIPKFSIIKILWRLREENFDIVSTQTRFYTLTWLGLFFSKTNNIPCVHTERGSSHSVSESSLIAWLSKCVDHTFGYLICRYSNCVVGVSEQACQFVRHLGAKKVVKIYNGVDTDFWKSSDVDNGLTISFVGRLVYAKGVQDLLRAVALINNKEIIVNIIGDGPYKKNLIELSNDLGINHQVKFWGELELEKIKDIFLQTSIFVNPSYSEGLPRSVLEAAGAGLPIIATNVGGTGEIVSSDHGFLIDPRNVDLLAKNLSFILSNRDLGRVKGQKLREFVNRNFKWDLIAQQYQKVFLDANK